MPYCWNCICERRGWNFVVSLKFYSDGRREWNYAVLLKFHSYDNASSVTQLLDSTLLDYLHHMRQWRHLLSCTTNFVVRKSEIADRQQNLIPWQKNEFIQDKLKIFGISHRKSSLWHISWWLSLRKHSNDASAFLRKSVEGTFESAFKVKLWNQTSWTDDFSMVERVLPSKTHERTHESELKYMPFGHNSGKDSGTIWKVPRGFSLRHSSETAHPITILTRFRPR